MKDTNVDYIKAVLKEKYPARQGTLDYLFNVLFKDRAATNALVLTVITAKPSPEELLDLVDSIAAGEGVQTSAQAPQATDGCDPTPPKAELPEGFSSWVPDDKTTSPFNPDVEVEVILRNGETLNGNAATFCWASSEHCGRPAHTAGSDIVAFRVLTKGEPDTPADDLPDGFIAWHGGECPVEEGTMVDVIFRDGKRIGNIPALTRLPGLLREATYPYWRNEGMTNDIVAYRVVEAALPDGFTKYEGTVWVGPANGMDGYQVHGFDFLLEDRSIVFFRRGDGLPAGKGRIVAVRPVMAGEHSVATATPTAAEADPINYQPGVWYAHDGGACPVPGGARVRYLMANGRKFTRQADWLTWEEDKCHDGTNIVAFKIKKGGI